MNCIKNIALLCLFFLYENSNAQQSMTHQTDISAFHLALENIVQEHYTIALQLLELLPNESDCFTQNREAIAYNIAVCKSALQQADATQACVEFSTRYPYSRYNDNVFFNLAKAFFSKKEYEQALVYFKNVNEENISYLQLEEMAFQKGYALFTQKKLNEALVEMEVVNVNQKSVYFDDANYYIGFINYKNDQLQAALNSFIKIDKNEKYKKIVPYYIVNIYSVLGREEEAIAYGLKMQNEKDILYKLELNYVLGQTYFKQDKYEESLPYLEAYVKQSNKVRKEDVYQLAFTQYKLERYEDAIPNFEILTTLQDSLGQNAMYHLGDCLIKSNQKVKAYNAFLAASKMEYNPQLQEDAAYTSARLAAEIGQQKNALEQLKSFIKKYPKSKNSNACKETITDLYLNTNNYDEALKSIEEIEEKSNRIKAAYQKIAFTKGTQLYNNLRQEEALQYFEKSSQYPIDLKLNNETNFWKGEINYQKKKYDVAAKNYTAFLQNGQPIDNINNAASEYTARYALGYCNLKKERYDEAFNQFNRLQNIYQNAGAKYKTDATLIRMNDDAILRVADCQFTMRDYSGASINYQKIITEKANGTPYAMFQNAIIQGLTGEMANKTNSLLMLINEYSNSLYVDDALLELGKMNGELGRYDEAAKYYTQLISSYSTSPLIGKCKNALALIYTNQNLENKAKELYKDVITTNPKSMDSKEAIAGLRNIYVDEQNPTEFINYLANSANIVMNETSKDSLLFDAAEAQYLQNNCEQALLGFEAYLNQFPNGVFALHSHYYRSDCYFNNKNYDLASKEYDWILKKNDNAFTEKSLLKAASIAYNENQEYEKAYAYYKRLIANSAYKEHLTIAKKGLLHTSFILNKIDETIAQANQLLQDGEVSNDELTLVYYYLGKCYLQKGETQIAQGHFKRMENYTVNKYTAEGQYLIAEILFNNNEIELAKSQCMYVSERYSNYEYWVVKGFVLLGDIYLKNKDVFQAKATYQSIVEGYNGDKNIIEACKAKIITIENNESNDSKLLQPNDTMPALELIENK